VTRTASTSASRYLATACVVGMFGFACGGGSTQPTTTGTTGTTTPTPTPTPTPTGQACRTYPARYTQTITTVPAVINVSATYTCSFAMSSAALTCSRSGPDFSDTETTTYASVADFVDEGAFLGRILPTRQQFSYVSPFAFTVAIAFQYDAQRRVTQYVVTPSGPGISSGATTFSFSGWEARGRPSSGRLIYPGSSANCTLNIAYDDNNRSIGWTFGTCPAGDTTAIGLTGLQGKTETYDSTFFLSRVTATLPNGTSSTTTNSIQSTFQVCK